MAPAHPPLIGSNHQPQRVDYALPFLYGKRHHRNGFYLAHKGAHRGSRPPAEPIVSAQQVVSHAQRL